MGAIFGIGRDQDLFNSAHVNSSPTRISTEVCDCYLDYFVFVCLSYLVLVLQAPQSAPPGVCYTSSEHPHAPAHVRATDLVEKHRDNRYPNPEFLFCSPGTTIVISCLLTAVPFVKNS